MDLLKFSENVGLLLKHGFNSRAKMDDVTKQAYDRIHEDQDAKKAFEVMMASATLYPISNAASNTITFIPKDADSSFVMSVKEFQKTFATDKTKATLFSVANIAVIATVYPSRDSINRFDTNAVRVEHVCSTLQNMIDFARKEEQKYGPDKVSTIADEFDAMVDTGAGKKENFKETYVTKALIAFETDGQLRRVGKDVGWVPTEYMRNIVLKRSNDGGLLMTDFLNRYYDAKEIEEESNRA